jgi:hypothetical protein
MLRSFGGFFAFAGLALCVLADCSSAQKTIGATPAAPQSLPRSSWMALGAKKIEKLLYVSDEYAGSVDVYDYKTLKSVGMLSVAGAYGGECVDAKGDVYITQFGEASVIEYAHGGKEPLRSFTTDGYTEGCSVNRDGDVAVGNFESLSFGQGDVQVFPHSGGSPRRYTSSDCYEMSTPGYDNKGNLFVEATDGDQTFVCELPAGGSSLRTVQISQPIVSPGSVMWDGKYLALTDPGYQQSNHTAIMQATESASGDLTVVGVTLLNGNCDGSLSATGEPFIVGTRNTPVNDTQGKSVVGINLWCNHFGMMGTNIWPYPTGGAPTAELPSGYDSVGQAVSIAK